MRRIVATGRTLQLSTVMVAALLAPLAVVAREIPAAPESYLERVNPLAADADADGIGQRLYERKCAKCHGKRGEGKRHAPESDAEVPVPVFASPGYLAARKDGQLFYTIENGSPNTDMDAWGLEGGSLTQENIWRIVGYIRKAFTQ